MTPRCPVRITSPSVIQFIVLCFLVAATIPGCGTKAANTDDRVHSADDIIEKVTEKGPVKLTIRVTPRSPRLSDLIEMDLIVSADKNVQIIAPSFGRSVGDFVVRDYSERGTKGADQESNKVIKKYHYQLEPMQAGHHLIRSMEFEFRDQRSSADQKNAANVIESEPLDILVTSDFGDKTPDLSDLEPMIPPRPIDESHVWVWVASLVAIGTVMAGWYWFSRRRTGPINKVPQLSAEEIAHAALAKLIAENLPAQGLLKEFYLQLTGIVRTYIEATTGMRAPEQTTEEFLREMRTRGMFTVDRSNRLKEFLEAADMVKYAGQQPGSEQLEVALNRAREFVGLAANDPSLATAESLEAIS